MTKNSSGLSIFIRVILFLAFLAGTIFCIWFVASTQLTNRESALLGFIVSALSVLAGWIITDLYGRSQYDTMIGEVREEHRTNLRMYALKASEKVSNLSNELNKLATYLEDELAYTDYRTSEEELLAKEERIESAIHIVRTLKTVNDTAMSDWEGVIGDELDERREVEQEKQQELRDMVERIQQSLEEQKSGRTNDDGFLTRRESNELRRQLERALFAVNNTTVPKALRKSRLREAVEKPCPSCEGQITYKQRPNELGAKAITCTHCHGKFVSTYTEKEGFRLDARRIDNTEVRTPCCAVVSAVPIDSFPGSSVQITCAKCGVSYKVIRTRGGVDIKAVAPKTAPKPAEAPTEEFVTKVFALLPPQPWPTGIHKVIAENLGLPPYQVTPAIQELIRRGKFRPQIDGILYEPLKTTEGPSKSAT